MKIHVCGRIVVCVPISFLLLCASSFAVLLIGVSWTCGRMVCINHNRIHSVEHIDSAFGSLLFIKAKNGNKCQVDLFMWSTVDNVYVLGNFNIQQCTQIASYISNSYFLKKDFVFIVPLCRTQRAVHLKLL